MAFPQQLLAILVCPQCKEKIRYDEKLSGLVCDTCKLLFEIKDDVPVLLIEEAKKLS
jgi:uncharacterized protein YbaR (Trm112 family)